MTNEKLNELKEAIEKAGGCQIINIYIDGYLLADHVAVHEIEIVRKNDDTPPEVYFILHIGDFYTRSTFWLQDHPAIRYEFKNVMDKQRVNIVNYCNGEITIVNR